MLTVFENDFCIDLILLNFYIQERKLAILILKLKLLFCINLQDAT